MSDEFPRKGRILQGGLLSEDDPMPFSVENESGKAACLVLCDHACAAVPHKLGNLGLPPEAFGEHWTHDIGALDVSRTLAALIDAPLIYCNYSRLVIDPNRRVDHPTAIPSAGEGRSVPGNLEIDNEERDRRVAAIYEPYHRKIEQIIMSFLERDIVPVIISVHSFTPVFFKQKRPWEVGVLWTQDPRLPQPVLEFFWEKGFTVGDNEPYDARMLSGSTLHKHADSRHLPNILYEIRNDLINTQDKAEAFARLTWDSLKVPLSIESLYTFYDGQAHQYGDLDQEQIYFDELIRKAQQGDS